MAFICFADNYEGYSGSGHDWETFSGDRSDHGDSLESTHNGWHVYSKNAVQSDGDDFDFGYGYGS